MSQDSSGVTPDPPPAPGAPVTDVPDLDVPDPEGPDPGGDSGEAGETSVSRPDGQDVNPDLPAPEPPD